MTSFLPGPWTCLVRVALTLLALAGILPLTARSQDAAAMVQISRQIEALSAEKRARPPAQRKLASALIYADRERQAGRASNAVPSLRSSVAPDAQGLIQVDITAEVTQALLDEIVRIGGRVQGSYPVDDSIRALVPLAQIEPLAGRKDVRFIQPAVTFRTNVGSVTSEGDVAHRANTARTTFGFDGTGVKVGVLSDSVDFLAASQAGNDLGPVTVIPGQGGVGAGEGTAMLEIVHDLAPGAELFFATAVNGPASFAQNLRALRAAGCQIVIDDVSYSDESPFQDGIVSRAVTELSNADVIFFSSATNSGNKNDGTSGTWEGDFLDNGTALADGSRIHNFGGGVTLNTVTVSSQGRVDLFWADPFGASTNDYDVFVADAGNNVVRASTGSQDGTQDPYEAIGDLAAGEKILIARFSGAARFLHLDTGRCRLTVSTPGRTRGHNAAGALNAFSVAATSAFNRTTPFAGGAANPVETFSSDGFRRFFFNIDGTAITPGNFSSTGGVVLLKPDVTAADGVDTTLPAASGLNPFFGTSAAAPHAGAIAALLKQARPTFTGSQLRAVLAASALDIEAAGFDRDSGPGIILAQNAISALPATVNLTPYTPPGWSQRIVVSTAAGNNTDAAQFLTTNTLFVDFGVANNGGAATAAAFTTELYVDGVLRTTATNNPALAPNGVFQSVDFNIGTLTAGFHTLRVKTDAGSSIAEADETDNEFTRTIRVVNAAAAPNLTKFTPGGWSDSIVISTTTGTNTDNSPLLPSSTLFVDFAIINSGTAVAPSFGIELLLDDVVIGTFTSPALNANTFVNALDLNLGSLPSGNHTITVRSDSAQFIAESNEADNSYTRAFTIAGAAPIVGLPSGAVTYVENAAPLILDAAATVTDGNSADFNAGSLTVSFSGTSLAEDRLAIRNQGVAAGQIGVSGANVTFGGTVIGTFTGGTNGSTPLVVTFTAAAATPAAAQALARNIAYQNVSDNPSATARTVVFVVNDGDGFSSDPVNKTVNVTPVNDAPTLAAISDPSAILEDATAQTINLSGIATGGGESQVLSISAVSNNTALIPNPTVTYTSPNATGSLSLTPVANASGSATITVTVQDDGGTANGGVNTFSRVFNVNVTSVNDAPTLAAIPDPAALPINAGLQTVNLSGISAGPGETQTLSVTAVSNNTALIPNPTVTYSSPNATGSLSYTPVTNATGSAVITVTVQDNGGTASGGVNTTVRTFTVAVTTNNAPTLAAIANPAAILEDAGAQTVNFSGVTTGGEVGQSLSVTATSDNTTLIPNPIVTYTSPNATGSLSYTPVANANGTAVITVTVNDGQAANNLSSRTFTVTVTTVNDAPALTAIPNPAAILEDAALQTINLSGISAGPNESQVIAISATSDNTSLIPNPTVTYTSPNGTGSLTYTPVANASGSAVITVTVQDNGGISNGGISTITRTFTVAVTSVNDAPTLVAIADPAAILEDAVAQTVNLSGITTGGGESQTLTVTAVSNNTSIIPNPVVTYTSPNATGSLTYTPVANATGSAMITVTVQDNGGTANGGLNSFSRSFNVNVTPVNDAPTLAAIPDPAAILEDSVGQIVNLSGISAGAGETQTLTVIAVSNNTAVVPNPTVTYSSPNAIGSLTYTPIANASGTAIVTVTVQDNGGTANGGIATLTRTFTVNVSSVNDAPTIAAIADPASILEDAPAQTINFNGISSGASENQALSVTAVSNNTALIPNPAVTYTSPNGTGSLTYTPVANASGSAVITVTVKDDGGTASSGVDTFIRTFTVNVTSVNDVPTIAAISDPAPIVEDAPLQTINFAGVSAGGGESQSIAVTASSNNTALIPNPAVSYASADATGSLSYTPVANVSGSAVITVTVQDNGGTANGAADTITRTFNVVVSEMNDAPTIAAIPNPAPFNEDAPAQVVLLSGISAGPNESQLLIITAASSDPTLIPNPAVTYASPSATGSLTFTPSPNAFGDITITVSVDDGQATDHTATQTFTISVNPVNDAPSFVAGPAISGSKSDSAQTLPTWATLLTTGPANESAQTLSFAVSNDNNALFSVQPAISPDGTLTFTPAPDTIGTASVTVVLHDDGGTERGGIDVSDPQTFTITIKDRNFAPSFVAGEDVVVPLNAPAFSGPGWITAISPGPASEAAQTVSFLVENDNNPLFTAQPTVSANGTLTFTPAPGATGVANITIRAQDSGGTLDGGVDTSAAQTFRIAVATFAEELGSYFGLVRPAPGTPLEFDRLGFVSAKFGRKGAFSAKVSLGKAKFRLKGAVQLVGVADFGKRRKTATAELKRRGLTPLVLDFDLDTAFGTDQLTGSISDGAAAFAAFTADRAIYTSKRNPKPPLVHPPDELLGKYTAIFPARTPTDLGLPASAFPQGDGIAFVKVSRKGAARIAGNLADGAKFSFSSPLTKANELPVHFLADRGRDILNGKVAFRTMPGSDLDATALDWLRLAGSPTKAYPLGWPDGIPLDLVGSKYIRSRRSPAIPWLPNGIATFTLADGGLAAMLTSQLNIDNRGRVKPVGDAIPKLKLKVSERSGSLRGSFQHPVTGKKSSITGVLLDSQQIGSGFFRSGTESGSLTLSPTP